LDAGTLEGFFRSPRPIYTGERPTQSAVRTSSPLRSLRPCPWNGASWRAGVGRVRRPHFWASCGNIVLLYHVYKPSTFWHTCIGVPQPARGSNPTAGQCIQLTRQTQRNDKWQWRIRL